MSKVILTAEQWQKRLAKEARVTKRDEAHFKKMREVELSVEDLRDEAMSIVRNTYGEGEGAYEQVHARMGAHPSTLKKWAAREVLRPQTPTLRAVLRACGHDLVIRPL